MSRKYPYIYKISKEIHKGTKITSNPLEKLTDHYVDHKINMRNDEGYDPWSQLRSARAPLSYSFLVACFLSFLLLLCVSLPSFTCLFIEKEKKLPKTSWFLNAKGTHSPRRVGCLGLKKLDQPWQADCQTRRMVVQNLGKIIILPFLLTWFLDPTNNHQNLQNHKRIFHIKKIYISKCTTNRFKGSL